MALIQPVEDGKIPKDTSTTSKSDTSNDLGYDQFLQLLCAEMLLRTPDIGGSSLEMNLYIAAFVFSLHKAEPDRITPEVVDEMVTAVFDSPFMVKAHENKKCTLFTDNVQDKKVQESIASQTSKYELDWKFHYEKGVDEFYNTYTECGIFSS